MGSPDFAATVLEALTANNYEVYGVVTQPDKPAGRGKVIMPPAVKVLSDKLNIPVIQPTRMKDPGVFERLTAWNPDLIVVAAFGQILRKNVLELPRLGCINVHASYLPRWRGAAPIQAALLAGDKTSGVSIMLMDEGIDTGAVLRKKEIEIRAEDTTLSLTTRLARQGADLLIETLPDFLEGKIEPQKQDDVSATYASMIKKAEALLDLTLPACVLERKVRAYIPWPVSRVYHHGQEIQVYKARVVESVYALPGGESIIDRYPALGTGQGWLILEEVQLPGKKKISGKDYLNGQKDWGTHNP